MTKLFNYDSFPYSEASVEERELLNSQTDPFTFDEDLFPTDEELEFVGLGEAPPEPTRLDNAVEFGKSLTEDAFDNFAIFWNDVRSDMRLTLDSWIFDLFENVALLTVNLTNAQNVASMLSGIGLFCKIYLPKSATSLVAAALTECFSVPVTAEDGNLVLDSQFGSMSTEGILAVFKNFVKFRETEMAKRVYSLISTIVACGLAKASSFHVSAGDLDIFKLEAQRKQANASDLIECILETVKFFFERGERCFNGAGISAFFSDQKLVDYDTEYAFIMANFVLFDVGALADIEICEHEYDRRLDELTSLTLEYLSGCKQSERSYYSFRLEKLKHVRTKLTLAQRKTVRRKPLGILLFGGSAVGKSAMANSLIRFVLAANGFDHDTASIVTLNEFDKFQSEYRSKHAGVIFDDLANGKVETTDGNPLMKVIQFLNNIPMAALNPNVELKGNVMIQPEIVLATTNVKELNARAYSNEPLSLARRFELTITVKVKDEFKKFGTDMLDPLKARSQRDKEIPDFNLFTVEEPYLNGADVCFRPLMHGDKPLVDIDIETLLPFIRDFSAAHFESQNIYVASQNALKDMTLCPHNLLSSVCTECKCSECPALVDSKGVVEPTVVETTPDPALDSQIGLTVDRQEIANRLYELETNQVARYTGIFRNLLNTRIGSAFALWTRADELQWEAMYLAKLYGCLFLLTLFIGVFHAAFFSLTLILPILCIIHIGVTIERRKQEIIDDLSAFKNPSVILRNACDTVSRDVAMKTLGAFAMLTTLYIAYRKYNEKKSHAAAPIALKREFEGETPMEFWTPRVEHANVREGAERNISTSDIETFVQRRLCHVRVKIGGKWFGNDTFPIKGNAWLIPAHSVPKEKCLAIITRPGGSTTKCVMSPMCCEKLPDTDFSLWYVPEYGPVRDATKFLAKEYCADKLYSFRVLFTDPDGQTSKSGLCGGNIGPVRTSAGGTFTGLNYLAEKPTENGSCMSALIGGGKMPFIVGFHLAGKGRKAAAGILTQAQVEKGLESLNQRSHILVSHSEIDMPTEILGVKFGPLTEPHFKSAVHSVPNKSHMNVYGQHTLPRASPRSSVITSKWSESITEVTGLERIHSRPYKMESDSHWLVDLENKTDLAYDFDDALVAKAFDDYCGSLQTYFKRHPGKLDLVGKLPDDVVVAGMDGVRGVKAINFKTSLGFPMSGPKTQFIEESERLVDGITCPRDVDPVFWEEVARMEQALLSGERINTVFKGSLKDEPTKLTKKKIRVFAGCNMAFTLLVRKYFLTMSKLMMDNRVIFECAVGVNVEGPDWEDLYVEIARHGVDRIVAGDYAAFDGRMSSKFMFAAFKLLINIAEWSGNYDEDDLTIMRGIASEISNPIYDFNGVLVALFGSNPSGHPLTVIINSLVNSLYLRYCYYSLGKQRSGFFSRKKLPPFNEIAAVMTYGDDNIMSVKEGYDWFNHTALAEEFAKVGITYTMADKESESVPFIHINDASFLKHFFVYDKRLQHIRSKIEEASIQKMLHAHVESKALNKEEQAMNGIVDALDKYFGYGPEVYEERRAQFVKVAEMHDCTSLLDFRLKTYDEQEDRYMAMWETYQSQAGVSK